MKRHIMRFHAPSFAASSVDPNQEKHLVCGAGGTRAILGSMGAIFGLHAQGVNNWKTIGGISGGAIIAALFAAGHHPRQLLRRALTIDFSKLIHKKHGTLKVLREYLRQQKHEVMPLTAKLCSEPLGKLIDELVPSWPDPLWIMAVADVKDKGRCQVLFSRAGTFIHTRHNECYKLTDEIPSVGLAVRGSCAIPGAIGHVRFLDLDLYDGVLSWDGRCPVGLVQRHFNADYDNIVGCDVGDYEHPVGSLHNRFMDHWVGDLASNRKSIDDWENLGVKIVRATVNSFSSLHLKPSRTQRSHAIRSGFHAAHETFKKKRVRKAGAKK